MAYVSTWVFQCSSWNHCFLKRCGTHVKVTHRIPSIFIMFSIIDFEQSIMAAISHQVKEWSSINVLTVLTLILVDSSDGKYRYSEVLISIRGAEKPKFLKTIPQIDFLGGKHKIIPQILILHLRCWSAHWIPPNCQPPLARFHDGPL